MLLILFLFKSPDEIRAEKEAENNKSPLRRISDRILEKSKSPSFKENKNQERKYKEKGKSLDPDSLHSGIFRYNLIDA